MKLSMSMIEGYLGPHSVESIIEDDKPTIHGMRFLSEGQANRSREYVYLGAGAEYLDDPRYADAIILASGKNHLVCRGLDYEELLNDVLSAFDFYNDAEQRLALAAARRAPLADMVAIVGEVLPHPFLVFGIDGAYLAGSLVERTPSESLRENIARSGSLGADAIGGYFTDREGNVQHDLSDRPRLMYGDQGEAAVNMYLYLEGEPIGFVMCFPDGEGGARLAMSVEALLAPRLSQAAEFTDPQSPHQAQRLAMLDLVTGAPIPDETIARLSASIRMASAARVVSVRSLAIRNRTQRLLLASEVEEALATLTCEFEENVIFLVAEQNLPALLAEVSARFDEKSAAVGVSMPIADLRQAPSAMQQSSFARETQDGAGIRHCRDLALPFLMTTLRNDPSTRDLLHPALGALAAYDGKTGSELLGTLGAYVRSGCSQSGTAALLHVHLNTLKYRLKRIIELTGLDFADQRDLFYLRLSLELLERN